MEDLAEGLVSVVARMLLVIMRFLIWFVWEVMCETLLWYMGWPVMRAITLGRLPEQSITNAENEEPLIAMLVMAAGLGAFLLLVYLFVKYIAVWLTV